MCWCPYDRAEGEPGAVERAAAQAYERAGVGPGDLDVLEVSDTAAPAGYGLIVVDECHHIPAAAFETAVRQMPAKLCSV